MIDVLRRLTCTVLLIARCTSRFTRLGLAGLAVVGFAGMGCSFEGDGNPGGDGDGDGDGNGDGDVDGGMKPSSSEFAAAHVPISGWTFGEGDLTIAGTVTIDTSDRSLSGASLPSGALFDQIQQLGASGGNPSPPEVALLRLRSLTVEPGGILQIRGDVPLIIAAATNIVIRGEVDASANDDRDGPGALARGRGQDGGVAPQNQRNGGGGGGGFGSTGGDGGEVLSGSQATGGSTYGNSEQSFLLAGSAGGRGREFLCDSDRGGGGGGIQLSAFDMLTLESGALIHANGGGGDSGRGCVVVSSGGAGGGSGGAIFLEGETVSIMGTVVANGGGGGAGNEGGSGQNGKRDADSASGGSSSSDNSSDGGDGATSGNAEDGSDGDGDDRNSGGGGGGSGRIRIKAPAPTLGGLISPTPVSSP